MAMEVSHRRSGRAVFCLPRLRGTTQRKDRNELRTTKDEPQTTMFERLEQTEKRYDELTQLLSLPETMNDSAKYQKTAKAHSEISPIVEKYREYKDLTRGIAESKAMLASETDADMRAYAEEELARLEPRVVAVE